MSYQKFHVLYGCRQGETFDDTECLDVGYEVNGYDVASLAIQPGSVSFSVLDYSYGPDDPTRAKVLNLLKKMVLQVFLNRRCLLVLVLAYL